MDLLFAAIRRNPVVLAVCLVATLAGGLAVWVALPVKYEVKSSYAVLPPSTVTGQNGKQIAVNPWQEAGGNAAQIAASALVTISESQPFKKRLEAEGVRSLTVVEVALAGGGVVIALTATDADPVKAEEDQTVLVAQIRSVLASQQNAVKAPETSYLRMQEITAAGDPTALSAGKIKVVGMGVVLGLILSLFTVIVADTRRKRHAIVASPPVWVPLARTGADHGRSRPTKDTLPDAGADAETPLDWDLDWDDPPTRAPRQRGFARVQPDRD